MSARRRWSRCFSAHARFSSIVAPSGAGKSSIVNACLARDPNIALSISFTSRAPRPGERHAQHYHFIGADEFQLRYNIAVEARRRFMGS